MMSLRAADGREAIPILTAGNCLGGYATSQ